MREFVPRNSINECTEDRGKYADQEDPMTCTHKCEQWSGTSTGKRPAESEYHSTGEIPNLIELLAFGVDHFTGGGMDLEAFDQEDRQRPDNHGRSNNTIHVEALEMEHLLYPEPRYNLGLDQYYPKERS